MSVALTNRLVFRTVANSQFKSYVCRSEYLRVSGSILTPNLRQNRVFNRKMSSASTSTPTYTSAPKHENIDSHQNEVAKMAESHAGATANRLIHEKSPYLLQHAYNPVDWYPWGPEAFKKAKTENKLIFLSVGYSTCHWCHVMERESFENQEIAQIMNENFVNIKVDREERPDVDKMYMTFVQASVGRGGWPMSVFLTPDLKPVYGGTYYPPKDGLGRPGFSTLLNSLAKQATSGSGGWPMSVWLTTDLKPVYGGTYFPNTDKYYGQPSFPSLLRSLAKQWKENPAKFITSGNRILEVLKESAEISGLGGEYPGLQAAERCFEQLQKAYEPRFGGFSRAPKFPQPVNLHFLLCFAAREPPDSKKRHQALEMCFHTLRMMAQGGIHDHVSKGFARYSTDEHWHVPHFEKMLYDQGQLAVAYAEAYVISKDKFFADIVDDILEYVSRDLSDPSGGFYSAEDADSFPFHGAPEKREGAFCVWTYREIHDLLSEKAGILETPKLSDVICTHFGVKPEGNVESHQDPHGELKGQNVLIIRNNLEKTAAQVGLPIDQTQNAIIKGLKILHEARKFRPRPHLDDKMLTAWNGLMISGFAKAGGILQNGEYIKRAVKAARFIQNHLYLPETQTLLRSCYKGETTPSQIAEPIPGFLDDYAFAIRSLLDLFEVTQNLEWVEMAYQLQETQNRLFWDATDEGSGYFTSPEGDVSILVRLKEDQDGAEPSGNSVSVSNLLRLAALLAEEDYRRKAGQILQVFGERLAKVPVALPEMVAGLISYEDSPTEVVVVRPGEAEETQSLLQAAYLSPKLLTGRIILCLKGQEEAANIVLTKRPDLRQMKTVSNRATAYVCRHRSCSAPVTSPHDLTNLLE